jgi:hypothetical protein
MTSQCAAERTHSSEKNLNIDVREVLLLPRLAVKL